MVTDIVDAIRAKGNGFFKLVGVMANGLKWVTTLREKNTTNAVPVMDLLSSSSPYKSNTSVQCKKCRRRGIVCQASPNLQHQVMISNGQVLYQKMEEIKQGVRQASAKSDETNLALSTQLNLQMVQNIIKSDDSLKQRFRDAETAAGCSDGDKSVFIARTDLIFANNINAVIEHPLNFVMIIVF